MKKLLICLCGTLLVLTFTCIAFSETINFDDIEIPAGQDTLYFLDEVFHDLRFSSPDTYDPNNPLYGWVAINRGSALTCGVSSQENSIFSGNQAMGRIKIEFPELVNFVQITGGDAGHLEDSFAIEAYDSDGNLLSSVDTGLFSGNPGNPPGLGYYVDQATLSISVPDIKYIYVFATTPTAEGGVSFDDLSYEFQELPPISELIANAGENISIYSEDITGSIFGTATYNGTNPLEYRWLWEETVLLDWTTAGSNNECTLLPDNTTISTGTYVLTLEVSDGQFSSSDTMILTILNSAPHAAVLEGAGTYQIGDDVILSSEVSDFDGDLLTFVWKEDSDVLASGSASSVAGGDPVLLPDCIVPGLDVGIHNLTLEVTDGVNDTVRINIIVEIIDTQAPTLAPTVSRGILWPPKHQMVEITIHANAFDNSGLPLTLSVSIMSNEPEEGLGDGDTFPDWSSLEIDEETGIINFQLRAERSGTGDGREYTIIITAVDTSNNSSSVKKIVIVPHDQSKK